MNINILGIKFVVSPIFCFILTFVLCLDPSGISLFSFLAIFLHEAGHLLAMILTRCKLEKIEFKMIGIEISANKRILNYKKELIVDVCGVLTNFLMFVLCCFTYVYHNNYTLYFFGAVNLVVGVFNLFPVYSLDGGDIIKDIFLCKNVSINFVNKLLTITTIISAIFMIILGIFCYAQMDKYPIPAISGIYFIILLILHFNY